ncbi:MAG: hypothetical protein ACTHMJ_23440, partial [Thermomicrobiales bacterium]
PFEAAEKAEGRQHQAVRDGEALARGRALRAVEGRRAVRDDRDLFGRQLERAGQVVARLR